LAPPPNRLPTAEVEPLEPEEHDEVGGDPLLAVLVGMVALELVAIALLVVLLVR
jgi:hypothetical protein